MASEIQPDRLLNSFIPPDLSKRDPEFPVSDIRAILESAWEDLKPKGEYEKFIPRTEKALGYKREMLQHWRARLVRGGSSLSIFGDLERERGLTKVYVQEAGDDNSAAVFRNERAILVNIDVTSTTGLKPSYHAVIENGNLSSITRRDHVANTLERLNFR